MHVQKQKQCMLSVGVTDIQINSPNWRINENEVIYNPSFLDERSYMTVEPIFSCLKTNEQELVFKDL